MARATPSASQEAVTKSAPAFTASVADVYKRQEPIWVRAEGINPWLIVSFGVSALLMAAILWIPPLQSAFQLTTLSGLSWLVALGPVSYTHLVLLLTIPVSFLIDSLFPALLSPPVQAFPTPEAGFSALTTLLLALACLGIDLSLIHI